MKRTEHRAYDALRSMVERRGGIMNYVRTGQPLGGAWIVQLPKKGASEATSVTFAYVDGGFPELDALYVPLRTPTRGWRDYSCELVENAEAKWFSLIDRYSKK